MKNFTKFSYLIFLLLTVASLSICYFGIGYEINKISPEIRAGMSDFDWIGIKWIFCGAVIQITAFVSLFVAVIHFIKFRKRG